MDGENKNWRMSMSGCRCNCRNRRWNSPRTTFLERNGVCFRAEWAERVEVRAGWDVICGRGGQRWSELYCGAVRAGSSAGRTIYRGLYRADLEGGSAGQCE